MADLEDIYEGYKKEIEHLDNSFLQEIKLSKSKKDSELRYLNNIKKTREKYYRIYLNELKIRTKKEKLDLKDIDGRLKKREIEVQKENPKKKEDLGRIFKVETLRMDLSKKEKRKLERELKRFKNKIKRNNLKRKLTPNFILILSLKIKLFIKRLYRATKKKIQDTCQVVKYSSTKFYNSILAIAKKIVENIKKKILDIRKKVGSKLKRGKKEENKSEDQKIAERLIAKS